MRARLVCQRGQLLKDWLTDDFYKNQIQPKLSNVACASVRQNAPEHDRPTRTYDASWQRIRIVGCYS